MAWTTPVDQVTGFLVTAAVYNAQIIDNLAYLHGDAGTIDISAGHNQLKADSVLAQPNVGVGALAYAAQVAGDTTQRFGVTAGGILDWSPGNAAVDTQLQRYGNGVLQLTNQLDFTYTTVSQAGGTTWTPTWNNALVQRLNVTSTGLITVASPSNPVGNLSAFLVLVMQNASGGVITTSWNAAFLVPPTAPANGQGTITLFVWDPAVSKWANVGSLGGNAV